MSIIDQANHGVVKFDPKTSKAFSGQRLSKVSYKTISDKENPLFGIKRESKCVSIPMIAINEVIQNVTILAPYMVEYMMSVQDKIIRELVDNNHSSIGTHEIDVNAIVNYLESNNESGRLTKESVGKWFDDSISDNLMMALAEKLGIGEQPTSAQSKQVESVVNGFKDKISALAGGKTMYEPKVCEALKKCIDLVDDGDILKSRFMGRLDKMIANSKMEDNLLDLL